MKKLLCLSILFSVFCAGCFESAEEVAVAVGLTYKSKMIPVNSMKPNENWSNSMTINLESIYDELGFTNHSKYKLESCKITYLYTSLSAKSNCEALSDMSFTVEFPDAKNIDIKASDADVSSTCSKLSQVFLVGIPFLDGFNSHEEYKYLLNHDFVDALDAGGSIVIKYDVTNGNEATEREANGIFVEAALDVEVRELQ